MCIFDQMSNPRKKCVTIFYRQRHVSTSSISDEKVVTQMTWLKKEVDKEKHNFCANRNIQISKAKYNGN